VVCIAAEMGVSVITVALAPLYVVMDALVRR